MIFNSAGKAGTCRVFCRGAEKKLGTQRSCTCQPGLCVHPHACRNTYFCTCTHVGLDDRSHSYVCPPPCPIVCTLGLCGGAVVLVWRSQLCGGPRGRPHNHPPRATMLGSYSDTIGRCLAAQFANGHVSGPLAHPWQHHAKTALFVCDQARRQIWSPPTQNKAQTQDAHPFRRQAPCRMLRLVFSFLLCTTVGVLTKYVCM